jgi:hypothetical protein
MAWFDFVSRETKKENLFEKYPDIELHADGFDPIYRIQYTECVKERGSIRFERKEKIVPKDKVVRLLSELLNG